MRRLKLTALLASTSLSAVGSLFLVPSDALANPQGGSVVSGGASIVQSPATPNRLVIDQTTESAVLNWQSFSIGAGQQVIFQQPNAAAIALNRVTGNQASEIAGTLTANGQVWLVNPNGVFFGQGAVVNVAGIVATTSDISNAHFMAGNYVFDRPGAPGAAVVNAGHVSVRDGGLAAFVAPSVANSGVIYARLGKVALASGSTFTVDLYGDNLVKFAVDTQMAPAVAAAAVDNSGKIQADGGTVTLSVAAAQSLVDHAINVGGAIEARTASMQNGKIVLSGNGGTVTVGGTLDASGQGQGQTGGTVEVLGGAVDLASGASVNVSGSAGGGTALIGGNFHGAGPQPDAVSTTVSAGVVIDADALTSGNGGNVAVWSDQATLFDGSITARGGAEGGNGGSVETSSRQTLSVGPMASVDTRAPKGKTGTWLLDPASILIDDADPGSDDDIASDTTDYPNFATTGTVATSDGSTGDTSAAYLSPAALEAQLLTTNVSLSAANSISFGTNMGISGGITSGSGNSLTLIAGTTINFAAAANGISVSGGIIATAPNISLGTNLSGGTGGVDLSGSTTDTLAAASVTISAMNAAINLGGNVVGSGTDTLTLTPGPTGSVSLQAVGNTTAVNALTVTNGTATLGGNIATGTGGADLSGTTTDTLAASVTISAMNAAINLGGNVVGSGADTLTLSPGATGTVSLQAVGNMTAVDALTVTDGAATLGGNIAAGPDGVDLSGTTTDTLAASVTISAMNAAINLGGNVVGSGTDTLTLTPGATGSASLQAVGNTTAVNSLTVTNGATTLNANVTTGGNGQTYGGAVTLGASVTLTDQASGAIALNSTLTGAGNAITIIDNVAPSFGGTVSGLSAATLAPFNGPNSIAVGDSSLQTLAGAATSYDFASTGGLFALEGGAVTGVVTIGVSGSGGTITMTQLSPTLNLALMNNGTGAIHVTGAYDGTGSLALASGTNGITLSADVTASGGISATAPNMNLGANLSGGAGGVDLSGTTTDTLAANVTISATNAAINLGGNVLGSGTDTLTLTPGASGSTSLQAVGNTTAVDALTVTNGVATLGGNIATSAGGADLSGTTTDTLAAASVTISAINAAIKLGGNVLGSGSDTLTLTPGATGSVSLQDVGDTTAVDALIVTNGTVTLGGNIATNTGGADLSGTTTDTLAAASVTISAVNAAIKLGGNVLGVGTDTLTLTPGATGSVSLQAVGNTTAVDALTVTTGSVTLGGTITTGADGVDLSGTTTDTLAANVTISATNAAIKLGGNVLGSGSDTLTVTPGASGSTSLQAVGNTTAVDALTVTNGAATLGGNIATSAGGADLSGTTTDTLAAASVTISAINAAIKLGGNVLGSGTDTLTLTPGATGSVSLQAVGNTTAVDALTVTNGTVTFNGNIATSAGGADLSGTTTDTLAAANVTISAINAAIKLGGNVLGAGADTLTLTPGATGSTSLQAVGNTTAVDALTVTNGAATLGGNIATSAGGVDLSGTTTDTLAANVTISATNAAIKLGGNVLGAGADTLTLTPGATGTVSLQAVGNTTAVDALTVTNGTATLGGNIATSAGGVDFSETTTDTLAAASVTISAINAAIKLGGNILGAGADTLTLTPGATGSVSLQVVGNTTAVDALTVTNGTATLNGNIATTGGADFSGTTTDTLAAASVTISAINAAIKLGGNVLGSGTDTLTLTPGATGSVSLQVVGNTTAVDALTVTNGAATLGGNIATTGGADLSGTTTDTLAAASVTISATNAAIKLGGNVLGSGADTLTLTPGATGTVSLQAVGNTTAVDALTVTNGVVTLGGDIATSAGGADLSGTTTDTLAAASVTISAIDAAIKLGGNVLGAGADTLTLTPGATGSVSLLTVGNTTAVDALTVTNGTATLGGNIATSAGGADFSGTTTDTLAAASLTISATNAAIKLGGNVLGSGADTLTLTPGATGSVSLQAVGNTTAVDALTVTNGTVTLSGNIATSTGGVDLSGTTTDTLAAANVTISAINAAIKLGGNVLGSGSDTLTLTPGATGTVSLQAVGNTTAVDALTVTNGMATLGGDIATSAGGADLSGTTTDTLAAASVTISAINAAIKLGGNVLGSGTDTLTLTPGASGSVSLQAVGNTTAVDALTVTNGAATLAGTIAAGAGGVDLSGTTTDTLAANVTISAANAAIRLGGNVLGAGTDTLTLTPGTTGSVSLQAVGNTTAVDALTVTNGAVTLTGTVTTDGGGQAYDGAVTLGASVTLTDQAAGTIAFQSTIAGSSSGGQALSVSTSGGTIAFFGTVGSSKPLGAVTLGDGVLDLAANIGITTSGAAFSETGATVLLGNGTNGTATTIATSGGTISFSGTIDGTAPGSQSLTLDAGAGTIALAGNIGAAEALGQVVLSDGALTLAPNTTIATDGGAFSQTGATVLLGNGANATTSQIDTTAGGSSGANISFSSTIDGTSAGHQALILAAGSSGTIALSGNVGVTTPLGAVTLSSGQALAISHTLTISGGNIFISSGSTLTITAPVDAGVGGAISLVAAGAIDVGGTLGATATGTISLDADSGQTGTAADAVTISAPVGNPNAGTMTLTGAAISLGAAIQGGGALSMGPGTGAANIGLGDGPHATADTFNLASSSIANIGSDFTAVSIATTGGAVHVDDSGTALLFHSPLTLSGTAIALYSGLSTVGNAVSLVGPVTLENSVTLDTTAGGATAGGDITLTSTVAAATAGTQGLTLNAGTGGTIAFSGSVGSGAALGAVSLTDKLLDLALDVGIATSDASFSQSGATLLLGGMNAGATTIATTGGNLTLSGAIDATATGQQALRLNAGAGTITLSGGVGAGTALGAITLDDATLDIGASVGSIKSNAAFSQTGATVLQGAATTIATSNGNIGFAGTIDGTSSGAQGLALQAGTGTITLSANVGSTTPLGAVTLSGGGVAIDASISGGAISIAGTSGILFDYTGAGAAVASTGGQSYSGAITLQAGTTLTDSGGNAFTFATTIDGTTPGGQALSVGTSGGTITLSGTVGAGTALGAVTLSGAVVAIDNSVSGGAISVVGSTGILFDHSGGGAAVTSTGGQTYSGAITLQANTTLTDSGGHAFTFNNTINGTSGGGQALDVGTSGSIALSGTVGSGTALGAVTLSGSVVAIDNSISGGAISVTGTSGIQFDHAGGGAAVTSTGGQTYSGAITLQAGTTLTDSGGNAFTFNNTIDGTGGGGQALSVGTSGGTITLSGTVGSGTPLGAVTLSGAVVAIDNSVSGGAISIAGSTGILFDHTGGAAVTSTGGQIYSGAVKLQASTSLTDSGGGTITFQNAIDGLSAGALPLTVSASGGTIALSGTVGAGTALGAVTLSSGVVALDASLAGSAISVAGSTGILFDHSGAGAAVTSTAGQTYSGAVTLQADTSLTDSGGSPITFQNTVNGMTAGGQALSVSTSGGTIALSASVGSTTPLGAVTLSGAVVAIDTSVSGGAISVAGSTGILFDYTGAGAAVTSTGGQIYSGAITLQAATSLTDSSGHAFTFNNTINGTSAGGQALNVGTSGTIALSGTVGSGTALGAVTLSGGVVEIDAAVSGGAISVTGTSGIRFDYTGGGAAVTSTGGQTYGGAVTLQAATSLTDSAGGAIAFQNTIDGTSAGGQALSVGTSGGTIALSGTVGSTTPLGAVTLTDLVLDLAPNVGIATSNAAISQSGATVLGGTASSATTLATSGGTISFGGAIDGSVAGDQALTLNAGAGTIALSGNLGSTTPLGAVTLTDLVLNLAPNVGIATASAPISQSGATVLGGTIATATTIASSGGTISFAGAIDGTSPDQQALVLSAGLGTIALSGSVGSATPLAAVTFEDSLLTITGSVEIATGGGAVSQTGASVLQGGTSATSVTVASSGGTIDFAGPIDGSGAAARSLSLAAGTGTIELGGPLGGVTPLGAVTLTDAVLDLAADVGIATANAPLSQSGATVLGGTAATAATIATSGGSMNFAGPIDGSVPGDQALTLAAGAGTITLAATIGSTTPLGAVTITDGALVLAANVGITTFDAAISLSGATVLGGTTATAATFATSGGNVTISGSLDGTIAGDQALSLAADTGTIALLGTLGNNTALAALSLSDGALEIAGNATIAGAFIQTGPFVLPGGTNAGTVTIDTTGGGLLPGGANITFTSTIDDSGEGKQALNLVAGGGTIALEGNVGATTPLAALTMSDAALDLGANVAITTAGGAVSQTGPTVLGGGATAATTIVSTNAGGQSANISFNGTIDGGAPGAQALILDAGPSGTVSLLGTVGGGTPLGAVMVSGGAIDFGANVDIATVDAGLSAEGPVVLLGGTSGSFVSISTQGGAIAFSSTIDGNAPGGEALLLDAGAGTVSLQGSVGAATALRALTLEGGIIDLAGNANITTAGGAVAADAPVVLVGTGATASIIDTTQAGQIAAGANISLVGVDGSLAGDQALTLNAGTGGTISVHTGLGSRTALGAVTMSDAALDLAANAGITTLGAAVSQTGATLLGGGTVATVTVIDTTGGTGAGGANITLGAIDASAPGAQAVQLAAGTGTITLLGAVGGAIALGAITLSDATLQIGPNVAIVNAGGAIAQTGATILLGTAATSALIETSAGVTFAGAIDGTLPGKQSLAMTGGTISLGQSIGAGTPLGALTLDGGAIAFGATVGITTAGGGVSVTGAITAAGLLTIDTTAGGTKPDGAGILFASGFDGGALSLTAGSGGTITLDGPLGATTPLAAVTLGDAALDIGDGVTMTTAGGPFSQTGATVLLAGATVAIDTNGGAISFAGTIDGAPGLTLNAGSTGTIVLRGNVGVSTPLGALSMTDAMLGIGPNVSIETAGGAVTNTGPVILLGGAITIATTGGLVGTGANIALDGGVNATSPGLEALTLAAGSHGTITLQQSLGGSTALGAVTVSGAAIDLAPNAGITTAGAPVSVAGAVVLGGVGATSAQIDTTNAGQTAAGASITLTGSVEGTTSGAQALTMTAGTAGTIALAANLGSVTPLGAVTMNDKVLDIVGTVGIATADAAFSQTGATILQGGTAATMAMIATSGGNVSFSGSLDGMSAGGQALTVDAGTGTVALAAAVGAQTALGALTLDDAVLDLAPNLAITTGTLFSQTGATVLLGGTQSTLTSISTGAEGEIVFAGTIDATAPGRQALSLSTVDTELLGNIGAHTPIGALTLTSVEYNFAGNIAIATAGGAVTELPVAGAFRVSGANMLEANGTAPTLMTVDTTAGGTTPAGANITFAPGISGGGSGLQSMTLNAGTAGTISLAGNIGGPFGAALGALTFTDAELVLGSDATVTTAGGAISQTGATILTGGTAASTVTISTAGDVVATPLSANISFAGPIDGSGAVKPALTIDAGPAGTVALHGNVGAATALGGLALGDAVLDLAPGVSVAIAGGNFAQNGVTVLLAGTAPTTTTITGANITFFGAVNGGVAGAQALALDAAGGTITLDAAVGGATPLGALTLGDSALELGVGANVTTAGGAVSETGATTLFGPIVLDTSAGGAVPTGGNVTFTGAIDGSTLLSTLLVTSLSVNAGTAGTIALGSDVGAHTALSALSLTGAVLDVPADFSVTTAGGAVSLSGDTIVAGGASPTTLTVNTTGDAAATGANIALGDVTGGASGTLTLALDAGTGGTIALLGNVGASAALAALSLTDAGLVIGPNASVTTAGTPFTETGTTVLSGNGASPTLATIDTTDHGARSGADITFTGSIDGGVSGKQSLTLDAGSAQIALGGTIGAATALGAVTLDDSTLRLASSIGITTAGGAVSQSGATLLLDPPPVGTTATLVTINTGGGGITFDGPIDGTTEGGQALSLKAGAGTISLGSNVGASVALGGLILSGGAIDLDGSTYQTKVGAITMSGAVTFTAPTVTIATIIPTSNGLPATTGALLTLSSVSGLTTELTLDPGIDSASIGGGVLMKIVILEGSGSSLTNLDVQSTSLGGEGTATGITVGGFTGIFAASHAFIRPGGVWTVNAGDALITDPALAGLTNSVLSNEGVGTAIALMTQIQQLIARGDTGETAAQQAFLQSTDRPDYAIDPFRQRYNILGVAQENVGGFEDLSYVTDGFWEGILKK